MSRHALRRQATRIMNLRYVITSMQTPQDPNYPMDHTMLVAIATFEGGYSTD